VAVVGVLVEELAETDFATLDAGESTHLPREPVVVEPLVGDPVPAQLYWRRNGNHVGKPSARYLGIVLDRARQAGDTVFHDLCTGSVDSAGAALRFV
jgi:hypothetical protein